MNEKKVSFEETAKGILPSMSSSEAYLFLDTHIEKEILFAYSGNSGKFNLAMRAMGNLVKRDTCLAPITADVSGMCSCQACGRYLASVYTFCPWCGQRIKE